MVFDFFKNRTSDPPIHQPKLAINTPHVFQQKISHFPNDLKYAPHLEGHFSQRYWIDDRDYEPGGPIIILDAGEIDGQFRLPFLNQGIVKLLAQTFHGVGSVLPSSSSTKVENLFFFFKIRDSSHFKSIDLLL